MLERMQSKWNPPALFVGMSTRQTLWRTARRFLKVVEIKLPYDPAIPLMGTVVVVSVTQLCPTLCDPMDDKPPGSSVHGILQARILEWVAISFSITGHIP